ncbi:hypothetical protein CKAH01_05314 [Colletotrichum kahawae]|uniref:Uncharacterized protein n=1 Tax=Colletotrichum kahawae TaxID=34407 RepID=A0AAD9YFC9_COLKA|nr:hypothetical protein CKAH01_05314 [Colletotrichum kahawae]
MLEEALPWTRDAESPDVRGGRRPGSPSERDPWHGRIAEHLPGATVHTTQETPSTGAGGLETLTAASRRHFLQRPPQVVTSPVRQSGSGREGKRRASSSASDLCRISRSVQPTERGGGMPQPHYDLADSIDICQPVFDVRR